MNVGVSGSVRLMGGIVPQHGYVEICNNGIWTRVCDDENYRYHRWTDLTSFVTCKQLNYPTSELRKKV